MALRTTGFIAWLIILLMGACHLVQAQSDSLTDEQLQLLLKWETRDQNGFKK